ncbi:hypothetical protein F4V91_31910 [Neorhizobium galegae]|uniref:Uncharacterized protein n=1 Tax=Neorhizobium galegae TaxID=399 RepID=A0A6A1TPW1_NEOGA|nr:hypothetical protein F4V91_31910 [Neorhizobium galegae]
MRSNSFSACIFSPPYSLSGVVAAPHPASATLGDPLPARGARGSGDGAAYPFSPSRTGRRWR